MTDGTGLAARRLWQLWDEGHRPDLAAFLAGAGPLGPLDLAAVLGVDQRHRWLAGQPVPAERYSEAYPSVASDPDALLDLVYAEYRLRREQGEAVTPDEYCQRFPALADQLRLQLDVGGALFSGAPSSVAGSPSTVHTGRAEYAADRPVLPDYEIQGELGRGGMSVVYRARHVRLNRVVALKMIRSGAYARAEERDRFQTEAEVVARLQHPNVVQVFEVGNLGGQPFLSLEFCPGGSLDRKLAGTPLPPPEAARLVETLAHAVGAAHARGVLHRDLKPANVLLAEDGTPKVGDFGLAKRLDTAGPGLTRGGVLGTPSYMPPEQARGDAAVGPAADVYALGAILYECLTGRPPFRAATGEETIQQVLQDEPVPPRRFQRGVPRDLETVRLKCLHKEAGRRYATAANLAEDLERFRDGRPVQARRVSLAERAWKAACRRPLASSLTAISALAALAVGLTLWAAAARDEDRRARARREVQGLLEEGRGAFRSHDYSGAESRADAALRRIQSEPGLADLREAAEGLYGEAGAERSEAADFEEFLRLRDDALFHGLNEFAGGRLLTGMDAREHADAARTAARLALERAGAGTRFRDPVRRTAAAADVVPLQRLLAGTAPAPDPAGAADPDPLFAGHDHFRRGDLQPALEAFNRAVSRDPNNFWAQSYLAVCLLRLNHWGEARGALTVCVARRPEFVWAWLLRGFADRELGAFAAGQTDFDHAAALLREHPNREAEYVLAVNRGVLHYQEALAGGAGTAGRFEQAIADLADADRILPGHYAPPLNRALIALRQGKEAEAEVLAEDAGRRGAPNTSLAAFHAERGLLRLQRGDHDGAEAACRKALGYLPTHPPSLAVLGQSLLGRGRDAEAAEAFDRYFQSGGVPIADAYLGRGNARMHLGRYAGARDDYTRALDFGPTAELYAHRGWAYAFLDAWRPALLDFTEATARDEEMGDAYTGLALSRVKLGDWREGVTRAETALRKSTIAPEMLHNLACVFALASGKAEAGAAEDRALTTRYRDRAVQLVGRALDACKPAEKRTTFWRERIAPDRDLDAIRDRPEFRRWKDQLGSPAGP